MVIVNKQYLHLPLATVSLTAHHLFHGFLEMTRVTITDFSELDRKMRTPPHHAITQKPSQPQRRKVSRILAKTLPLQLNTFMVEAEKLQMPVMTKELDANTWWEAERDDPHPPGTLWMGVTPLLEVCKEAYGWNEEKALRVSKGYRQFLILQRRVGNPSILEPSTIIDKMWVQHVSSRNYEKDCLLLCGFTVPRDGYNRLDHVSRAKREEATKQLLLALFPNELDKEIWSFGEHSMDSLMVKEKVKHPEEESKILFRAHMNRLTVTHTPETVLAEAEYDMPLSMPFVVPAALYASGQEREYRELLFVVEGVAVDPHATLKELNFQTSQVVDVIVKEEFQRP